MQTNPRNAADAEKRLVFFDLETAGLDPARHAIIQVAALAVDSDLEPIEGFEAKLRFDESRANRTSLRKNHFSRGVWATDAVKLEDAARDFAAFLRRHATVPVLGSRGQTFHVAQLAAHNAAFDGPFLIRWFEKLGLFLPARRLILCTMQRALWLAEEGEIPTPKDFKLATLCEAFGVNFPASAAHDAWGDVLATAGLYRALMHRCHILGTNSERYHH